MTGTTPLPDAKQYATELVRTLRERGHRAYFAGGCVRDLLLGREPADYDVATDATPQQVMGIFPRTLAVGEQFGVVLVPISPSPQTLTGEGTLDDGATGALARPNEHEHRSNAIEVATFRSDVGYSDGRHPDEVRFTSDPREDVQRRDFTINGMLLDPLALDPLTLDSTTLAATSLDKAPNPILDFVGGRADLKAGIVRAIGEPERRFSEDKLRMLRGVRFAARFGYQIDPATFSAMTHLAPQIHQVSRERVRGELTQMLTEGRAQRAFQLLDESGLLREVLPEISAMKGVEQPPQYHPEGDVFVHTLLLLAKLPGGLVKDARLGSAAARCGQAADVSGCARSHPLRWARRNRSEDGGRICRRLRFSNDETDQILALVDNHMRFGDVLRMKESTLKKFLRLPAFDEHLELHRIDCLSSHGLLDAYNYASEQLRSTPAEAMRPAPLITGDDLIAAGYQPGPRFKEILSAVEDAQLEGRLASSEAAMEFVRREFPVL